MAVETVAANGSLTGVKKGKEGFARFKFPSNHMGLAAFDGSAMRAYIQDWSIDSSFKYLDVTPMGEDDPVEVPDGVEVSGSANMNFRTGSAPLLGFVNTFSNVIDKGELPANDVEVAANPEAEITVELFVDDKHYWQGQIHLQSANSKGSAGSTTTFGVSWKFVGKPTYIRLPAALVEA